MAVALGTLAVGVAHAQGRGGATWNTGSADAQRTAWLRTETRISLAALQAPRAGGFQLLWKVRPANQPRQLNALTQPLVMGNLISHLGFKSLAFVGGSSDVVYAYDYDLAKVYWSQKLSTAVNQPGTLQCPGGLTALTRQTPLNQSAVPVPGARGAGPGGFGPAPPARGPAPVPGQIPQFEQPLGNNVWAISSGGMLHVLNPHVGIDARRPVRIVPAGAKVGGSVLINNTLYATTQDGCGGAPNGVWRLDVTNLAANPTPTSWDTGGAALVGNVGPTVGLNNVVYVATGSGSGNYVNAVVALDPDTLQAKDWFAAAAPFVSAPVAFNFAGRDLVAAANRDGRLYLLDGTTPGGADHRTPVARSAVYTTAGPDFTPGAVSTWQDAAGVRWLLVASAGPTNADARFAVTNGAVTNGTVAAFRVTGSGSALTLEPAWTSRDLASPVTPIVLNDVVFALSSGAYRTSEAQVTAAQRLQRSTPAVLYALDAKTGKELWSSGATITASVQGVGPSGMDGQVYVAAADGTLYAFGIPMEH